MVTSNEDRLRFESFSGCCGVHARLDLLPDALDEGPRASGTTNVDFNHPMRAALASAVTGVPPATGEIGQGRLLGRGEAVAVHRQSHFVGPVLHLNGVMFGREGRRRATDGRTAGEAADQQAAGREFRAEAA